MNIIYKKFIIINMIIFYIIYFSLLISITILTKINKLFNIYHFYGITEDITNLSLSLYIYYIIVEGKYV